MSEMAADRVYAETDEPTEVFVAADVGIIAVSVAGERVGRFGVERRCTPRDIAGQDGLLAVATDEDALLSRGGEFEPTGFGAASAVGIDDGTAVAADHSGRLARYTGDAWTELGRVPATVAAIDGSLVATDDGVYRLADGELRSIGHRAVRDVAARGAFAATESGLYAIEQNWQWELEGQFRAVAADGPARVLAAGSSLLQRWGEEWETVGTDDQQVADVAIDGRETNRGFALTEAGSVLVGPSFRGRSVGARGVVGLAVP